MPSIEQRKAIDAVHLAIQRAYIARGKPAPVKYDAWSQPTNSHAYRMR